MDLENKETQSHHKMDLMTQAYINIRDHRAKLSKEFEAEDKRLEEQMKIISNEMSDICKEMNASSIKTKYGTIIRSVKQRYWTNDWDSMYQVIKEHDAFALLTRSIHQSNMKEFLAENPDLLPKGLNVDHEYTVVVRRSKE